MTTHKMRVALAGALTLTLALGACQGEPDPQATPAPTATLDQSAPTPEETPTPQESATEEVLVSDEQIEALRAESDDRFAPVTYTSAPAGQDGSTITWENAVGAGQIVLPDAMEYEEWFNDLRAARQTARNFLKQRYGASWRDPEHTAWIEQAPATERMKGELREQMEASGGFNEMMVRTETTFQVQIMEDHALTPDSTLQSGVYDLLVPYRAWEESHLVDKPPNYRPDQTDPNVDATGVVWEKMTMIQQQDGSWLVDTAEPYGEFYKVIF